MLEQFHKAAAKIQDFYANTPKDVTQPDQEKAVQDSNNERKISEDEFSVIIFDNLF